MIKPPNQFARASLLLCLVLIVRGSYGDLRAQSLTRDERIELANKALLTGDYETVVAEANELLSRWPRSEEGLVFLATANLFGPNPDPTAAQQALRKLPRKSRQVPHIRAMNLWKDHRYGGGLLPAVKKALQMNRALDLLADDPLNPIANLVAGHIRLQDFRGLDGAVRFSIDASSGNSLDNGMVRLEPIIRAGSEKLEFRDRRTGQIFESLIWDDNKAEEVGREAIQFLIRANMSGPLRKEAFRHLSEATQRAEQYETARIVSLEYVADFPEMVEGHLFLGLAYYQIGDPELASSEFQLAIDLMSKTDRLLFSDPRAVVSTSVKDQFSRPSDSLHTEFWIQEDPLWSSPENERLIEHRARMAYADLIWGRPDEERKGWKTEPGQVVVRYGWPVVDVRYQDDRNSYLMMHYGYRAWLFMDLVKAGNPIFYSPSAVHLQGARAPVTGNDWVLLAREYFRDDPARSQRTGTEHVDMDALPSVFRNMDNGSRTVIVPVCAKSNRFSGSDQVRVFDRAAGAPIPDESSNHDFVKSPDCPSTVLEFVTGLNERHVSLEAETFRTSSVYRFKVPPVATQIGIELSDILLAKLIEEREESPRISAVDLVTRSGLDIYPKSSAVYSKGEPIYIYFEVYGFEFDPVQSEATLTIQAILVSGEASGIGASRLGRLFGRRDKEAVSVEFEDVVREKSHSRYLILETDGTNRGIYTLVLQVTDSTTNMKALVSREIEIE